jgi:hypothetical protein
MAIPATQKIISEMLVMDFCAFFSLLSKEKNEPNYQQNHSTKESTTSPLIFPHCQYI